MLPLLRIAGDGREHSLAEARETLAGEFKLSAAEQDEPLPSGSTPTISTRQASSRTSRAAV
jgi:restriction system protein